MVVIYGVVMRYAFNNRPPYVEQVALLLVISVRMLAPLPACSQRPHRAGLGGQAVTAEAGRRCAWWW